MSEEENRASDNPQPSSIRKSAHIRGFRAASGEGYPPEKPTPTLAAAYMMGHASREYPNLVTKQAMIGHGALSYSPALATQLMIGHSAVV